MSTFNTTKVLHFSPKSKVFPHGVTLNNVNAEIQLIHKEIQLIRVCISCICGATTAVSFPYQLYYSDYINKNHKNPFVLVETTSLMPCLYALPSEPAHCQTPQPHHPSPRGFQPGQKKNQEKSPLEFSNIISFYLKVKVWPSLLESVALQCEFHKLSVNLSLMINYMID